METTTLPSPVCSQLHRALLRAPTAALPVPKVLLSPHHYHRAGAKQFSLRQGQAATIPAWIFPTQVPWQAAGAALHWLTTSSGAPGALGSTEDLATPQWLPQKSPRDRKGLRRFQPHQTSLAPF